MYIVQFEHTHPSPQQLPAQWYKQNLFIFFFIKYLYFKFSTCSGLKSGYNWKYALKMRNRYTLCEYISCLMIRHISSFWVATWCNRSPAKVHSPKSSRRQHWAAYDATTWSLRFFLPETKKVFLPGRWLRPAHFLRTSLIPILKTTLSWTTFCHHGLELKHFWVKTFKISGKILFLATKMMNWRTALKSIWIQVHLSPRWILDPQRSSLRWTTGTNPMICWLKILKICGKHPSSQETYQT